MIKPPKKPIPYSRYNYPHYEDYEQKMRIWETAMGVWLAKNQEEQP